MKKKPKRTAKKASKSEKIRLDRDATALVLALRLVGKRAAGGDEVSAQMLWAAFNWLAGALAMMIDQKSCALDMERLFNIAQRCDHMLREAVRRKDAAALPVALSVAAGGCDILREAANQNTEFVASFAESASDWPVLMACKKSYHEDADTYLRLIRVGTKSVPRTTAATHVNTTEIRSAELASMVLAKLMFYRTILVRDAAGLQFPAGSTRTAEQRLRIEAREFKESLELESLTNDTWKQWWGVGRRIVGKYWKDHPKQEVLDVQQLGGPGRNSKSPKAYALEKIRSAFYTAAKAVFPARPAVAQS